MKKTMLGCLAIALVLTSCGGSFWSGFGDTMLGTMGVGSQVGAGVASGGNGGYYIPAGGTEAVPVGYKPTIVGGSHRSDNSFSLENSSVNGVPATMMQGGVPATTSGSSSTSSSSSSSHQKACPNCGGRGRCHTCGGKGRRILRIGDPETTCGSCGGSGQCRTCNGSGKFGTLR